MSDPHVAAVLSELDPREYFAAWRYVSLLEQLGEIDAVEAESWRVGNYERVDVAGAITDDANVIH